MIVSQDVREDSAIEVGRRLHDLDVTCFMAIGKSAVNVTLFRLLTHRNGFQIAVSKVHRYVKSLHGPRQVIRRGQRPFTYQSVLTIGHYVPEGILLRAALASFNSLEFPASSDM